MAGIYIDPLVQQLAQMVTNQIGMDTNVVLAQWQAEEGVGSANWPNNNPAGITPGNSAVDKYSIGVNNGFDVFPTPTAGAKAYATLYATDPNYASVRAAIATGSVTAQLNAIIQSPWDAGHYRNGQSLYGAYNAVTGQSMQSPNNLFSSALTGNTTNTGIGNLSTGTIQLPTSIYGISGQTQYGDILYGRRYRILVTIPDQGGAVALDVSALHVEFDVQLPMNQFPPYSTVTIYNPSTITEYLVILEGYEVTVEAGYVGNQYGQIYSGVIVQPVRSRPDNVTEQLTLYCLPKGQAVPSLSSFQMLRGQSLPALIKRAITTASVANLEIGTISPSLNGITVPRGVSYFGLTRDLIDQICSSVGAQAYTDHSGKINIFHPNDVKSYNMNAPNKEVIQLTPQSGLIGMPTQQNLGIQFQALLNPQITLGSQVQISGTFAEQATYQVAGQGANSSPPMGLSYDGIYFVISVEHQGDTRGQNWYTTATGVSQTGSTLNLYNTGANVFG